MAHIKVWLSVCLTLALAALLWMIPEKLNQQLQFQQRLLVPLSQNSRLQDKFASFYKKVSQTVGQLAGHGGLKGALGEIEAKRPDRRNRKHKKAHQNIEGSFRFFRGPQQNKRLLVVSSQQTLVYRSDQPKSFPSAGHPLVASMFASRALKGKPQLGYWRVGSSPFLVASAPIRKGAQVIGALLQTMKVDQELFVEAGIDPGNREANPMVLLDQDKPLAYAVPKGMVPFVRRWVTKHYLTLSQELQKGSKVSKKTATFNKHKYGYIIHPLPTPASDIRLGYVLFAKLPQTNPNDLFRGDVARWIGAGTGIVVLLLALWFSLGLASTRRKLLDAIQLAANMPGDPKSVDGLPSSFKKLGQPLRSLMQKASQPPPPASAPVQVAPPPAPTEPSAPLPSLPEELPLLGPKPGEPLIPAPSSSLIPLHPSMTAEPVPSAPPPTPAPVPHPAPTPAPVSSLAEPGYKMAPPPSLGGAPPTPQPEPAAQQLPMLPDESLTPAAPDSADLADELEMAFAGIASEPAPTPSPSPSTNRQTLMYEQFGEDDLETAKAAIKQERMQKVYDSYIEMRQQCGESVENIDLEAFVQRLDKQRESILSQIPCTDVQFHVYEKAGKAAIKATPIT